MRNCPSATKNRVLFSQDWEHRAELASPTVKQLVPSEG